MPHKKNKVRNSVIERLVIQSENLDRAMSTIKPIPKGTYKERATFHGEGPHSADYQGPMGGRGQPFVPGTKDRMPGTTPIMPEQRRAILDSLLEFLQIKPKKRKRKNRPVGNKLAKGFI